MDCNLKTKILSLSLLFSLAGCGEQTPPPAPPEKVAEQVQTPATPVTTPTAAPVAGAAVVTAAAAVPATEQSEEEKKELAEFLAEAKKRDPNIIDAYYSVDDKGNKIINLVRNADPAKTAEGEKPAEEGLGMLETVGLAMAGGMVGSMLANALVPSNPAPNYYQQNSAYYQRQTPEEAERYRSSATSSYNNHLSSFPSASRSAPTIGKSIAPPPAAPSAHQTYTPPPVKPAFKNKPTRGFKKRR